MIPATTPAVQLLALIHSASAENQHDPDTVLMAIYHLVGLHMGGYHAQQTPRNMPDMQPQARNPDEQATRCPVFSLHTGLRCSG